MPCRPGRQLDLGAVGTRAVDRRVGEGDRPWAAPIRASRVATCHHRPMTAFDLLLRGGTVVDGTGAPARRADVGVLGDRILAVGDLAAVDDDGVERVLDVDGRVVAPGFVDPHGHSDGSLFLDGALASHLHQGYTTQLSGNCGDTLAPITDASRELVDLSLRANELEARWATFGEYLDRVAEQPLGPNVAFLAGHGTIRGSVVGADAREASAEELAAMVAELEAALDAGAFGLSSGLIYAPGMHAPPAEIETLVGGGGAARRAVRDPHAQRGRRAVRIAGRVDRRRSRRGSRRTAPGVAPEVRLALGMGAGRRGGRRCSRRRGPRGSMSRPTSTRTRPPRTTLATILPPALQALGVDACVDALTDPHVRDLVRAEIARGISGWENVASDPGWEGLRISYAASRPEWSGRTLAELAAETHDDPADLAFDALVADRLDVSVLIECMTEPDVETILAVPWIAVCTDAEGRRPDHPILDAGRPHPRTYGTTARVLGPYVRERAVLSLEAAVAKLSAVPAARLGLRDRGVVREGAFADLVVLDPEVVADRATDGGAGALPDRHRPRHRQRAAGDPRRSRDGRSTRPAVAPARDRAGVAVRGPGHRDPRGRPAPGRTARLHAAPLAAIARSARGHPP